MSDDLAFAGAARIAEMVRAKEVSPSELVELYLERIGSLEPRLNAYRVVLPEGARADAKCAEERLASGDEAPLLGVPVAVKDNVDYAGEVTTEPELVRRAERALLEQKWREAAEAYGTLFAVDRRRMPGPPDEHENGITNSASTARACPSTR